MIGKESLSSYSSPYRYKDRRNLVVAPHELLSPYIANYTFTVPSEMPLQQTILPTASSSLVYSVSHAGLINGLRGVNTQPTVIGGFAKQFDFMFLIEFHSGGLYPFLPIDQHLLLNGAFAFEELSKPINQQITDAFFQSETIDRLKTQLDTIFLTSLDGNRGNPVIEYAIKRIVSNRGLLQVKDVASSVFYSEKQLNRLFQKHIGTNVKTFSRVVRMKYAADSINQSISLSEMAEVTGHVDASHFSHDFKRVYGITPGEFRSNMSIFYNDAFKLLSDNH